VYTFKEEYKKDKKTMKKQWFSIENTKNTKKKHRFSMFSTEIIEKTHVYLLI